jgi:hypothetical protein
MSRHGPDSEPGRGQGSASQPVSIFARRQQEKLSAEESRQTFTSVKLDMQGWLLCDPCLSANAKLVAIYLLRCVNAETGQCNPSAQTIGDELVTLSLRAVERAVAELKTAGWIGVRRYDRRKSNGYVFIDNRSRANAIDDRRELLREARHAARLEPPVVAGRGQFDPPRVAGLDPPRVAGKHLNGTPEVDSLYEQAQSSNQFTLASRGR